MRQTIKFLTALLMLVTIAGVGHTWAQSKTPYAVLTDNTDGAGTKTLTFKYGDFTPDNTTSWDVTNTGTSLPKWYSEGSNITQVVFESSFADARPKSCSRWFNIFRNLTTITGIENLNTSEVTNMRSMFNSCSSLTSLDLSHFDTNQVTDMSFMFCGCSSLTSLDLSSFDTSKVERMSYMFKGCSGLKGLDVSSFNTSEVTRMDYMFFGCDGLTSLAIGKDFAVGGTINTTDMFNGCTKLANGTLYVKGTTPPSIAKDIFGVFTNGTLITEMTAETLGATVSGVKYTWKGGTFNKPTKLANNLGANVTVTFYDGGAAEPTGFDVTAPGTPVTSADAGQWIVMHIVPADGYWTDAQLLMAMEKAAAPARAKAPGFELGRIPTLLKRDTYTDAEGTYDRQDGAGWYYYQIPADHTYAAGYTQSDIEGYVANKFNLSDGAVDIIGTVITVTGIKDPLLLTPNDWTAEFTYDQLSYVFDATPHKPTLQSVVIKKAGVKIIELTGDAITKQVKQPEAQIGISSQHGLCLEPANSDYTWFYGMVSPAVGACFKITIPFGGSGTVDDPWQIKTAADLNMLSKCSNIGRYKFEGEYLKQMNTEPIDMSGVTDFIPICLGSDEGLAFRGIYDGDGRTICNLTCNHVEPAYYINYGYVGLFGFVDGGTIQNVVLKDCKFTTSFNASAMGGIAGYVKKGTLSGNRVTGACSISNSIDNGGITGAIVGMTEGDNTTLTIKNNKYDYTVGVSRKDGSGTTETASGYTKRGYWTGTAWADITVDEGAMLNVKKATVPAANGNGSAVTFNQVTKGVDRYDSTGDDFYYAVGKSISVTVTPGVSKPDGDIRTFYDQLNTLTMNGTDIKDALSFAMPDADATIAATFALSDWFTIDSNQKEWMSFYHKWEPTVAMNYSVTDGSGTGKTISALTITDINLSNGSVTTGDLGGVSFNGMPTLFHCKNGLPEKLKFTPDANASTNVTPSRYFSGTAEKMDMSSYTNVYVMNGIGDFYFAEDKSVQLAAHRCYVDLGSTAIVAPARLHIVDGEATGIETPSLTPSLEGAGSWYSLDGRKLDGKPTKKGLYINNGRTIVIK